ncbi:MAG: GlsB/YeaQ/YmgE family stress response membrane protein [Candidatus Izemoplasmatales bacterium]|uniref:GlsB/YeaQ/YmgE family stress response membrane protein n=1 Tax=Hujiaoplasma nucleasis TaxID=2725268 RepID=A0A7L6N5P8_9MOLU|nr:GlsB/YeaQ/YmgE family stress response membrane protein [Hujiaoplasma nucleasis]QLY40822.1 GlsB/YeaQ/YmgE family stress response membrane protein [Hujiaoplasma nucleasis]
MGLILWILFGLIVGWIANTIMDVHGKGFFKNLIIGLIGSAIGGWIGDLIDFGPIGTFTLSGFIFAVIGAIILIWLLRKLRV